MVARTQDIKLHLTKQFSFTAEQVEMMLPSFISTLASHLNNLESAVDGKDPELVGKAGHTLKGALLNLGLADCAVIALEMEQNGKRGNTEFDYETHLHNLRNKIGDLL